MCEQFLFYCRIYPEGLLYDAERDLLAIAKFLVLIRCKCNIGKLIFSIVLRCFYATYNSPSGAA